MAEAATPSKAPKFAGMTILSGSIFDLVPQAIDRSPGQDNLVVWIQCSEQGTGLYRVGAYAEQARRDTKFFRRYTCKKHTISSR